MTVVRSLANNVLYGYSEAHEPDKCGNGFLLGIRLRNSSGLLVLYQSLLHEAVRVELEPLRDGVRGVTACCCCRVDGAPVGIATQSIRPERLCEPIGTLFDTAY